VQISSLLGAGSREFSPPGITTPWSRINEARWSTTTQSERQQIDLLPHLSHDHNVTSGLGNNPDCLGCRRLSFFCPRNGGDLRRLGFHGDVDVVKKDVVVTWETTEQTLDWVVDLCENAVFLVDLPTILDVVLRFSCRSVGLVLE
ncbi:hypothetical protein BaRGS_00012879, partial [Batillaria attramentaria]